MSRAWSGSVGCEAQGQAQGFPFRLLYAQRVNRIVRLTVDDLIRDGNQVLLRLGEPPSPVPTPFAEILFSWISERDNMESDTFGGVSARHRRARRRRPWRSMRGAR
jgi:hypothetical protein